MRFRSDCCWHMVFFPTTLCVVFHKKMLLLLLLLGLFLNQVYAPFFAAGKAVLNAEFEVSSLDFCNTIAESIDSIVKVSEQTQRNAAQRYATNERTT